MHTLGFTPSQRILINAVEWLQNYVADQHSRSSYSPRTTPPAPVWSGAADAFQRMDAEAQREDQIADEFEAELCEVDEEKVTCRRRLEARRDRLRTKRNHHRGRAYAIREERRRREQRP